MPAPYPWWSKKWWYPNCCCHECIIFHDDCRGYVDVVPANWWTPVDSAIWQSDAFDTSTSFGEVGYTCSSGFMVCDTEITESPYNCVIGAKFLWATATDLAAARLLCDYVDDDNFHWVEVDHDGSRTGDSIEITFWDRASGTDTQIGSAITVDSTDLTGWPEVYVVLCKTTTMMTLNVFNSTVTYGKPWPPFDDQDTSFFAEAAITDKGGKKAGVGMSGAYGTAGGTRPDDDYGIRLREYWLERSTAENSNCEACERFCCSDTLPLEFDVTLSGITNDDCTNCSELNDTFTLVFTGHQKAVPATSSEQCFWKYESSTYGGFIWECDETLPGSEAAIVSLDITVAIDTATNISTWDFDINVRNGSGGRDGEYRLTRTGSPGSCAFTGSESWTEISSPLNAEGCNWSGLSFTIVSS